MDLKAKLRRALARDGLTLEELVAEASSLLRAIAPRQTRYKVTARPDARTIRYYVTQGLLPRPEGYDGGRARYGGRHLIRLLSIKRLQAEHQSLRRIAHALAGASDDQVLALLLGAPQASVVTATPPPPAVAGETYERLDLSDGARVEVPTGALADPARRRALARSLRSLARWLDGGDDQRTPATRKRKGERR